MIEATFQSHFMSILERNYPAATVIKVDPTFRKSFPDVIMLGPGSFWGAFETKRAYGSPQQPNQSYYIDVMDAQCFGRFVQPENLEEVLRDLEQAIYFGCS